MTTPNASTEKSLSAEAIKPSQLTHDNVFNYLSEIMLLIFLEMCFPITISVWYFKKREFEDVFVNSFICLFLSLILCHITLYFKRKKSSMHLPRLIDYVYLAVASLGLFSAFDFNVKRYQNVSQLVIIQSMNDLDNFGHLYDPDITKVCADQARLSGCALLRKLAQVTKDSASSLRGSPLLVNVNLELSRALQIADKSQLVSDIIRRVEPNLYEDYDSSIQLDKEPIGIAPSAWNFEALRTLGYYLIASAIALQITRVSVEIWSLFRRN